MSAPSDNPDSTRAPLPESQPGIILRHLPRIEVMESETLLSGWSRVIRVFYRLFRRDGSVQTQDRDLLNRGDGVTVLLFNRERQTVLLLRQPRISAVLRGHPTGETIEVCNGQVEDGESPFDCAMREVEQETGHRLAHLIPLGDFYASPGASLEIVHLFAGEFGPSTLVGESGGLYHEGEDIETFEIPFAEAMQWIDRKIIVDARSTLALQLVFIRRIASDQAIA